MITQAELVERLTYNPKNGFLRWKDTRNNFRKNGSIAGSVNSFGYIRISIDDRRYMAHRLAWLYMTGVWPKNQIDHINLNKADNRWCNLREATRSQNHANTPLRATNTSGIKGVHWHKKTGTWQSSIRCRGLILYLGSFRDLDEAKAVYDKAAKELFGEFARVK